MCKVNDAARADLRAEIADLEGEKLEYSSIQDTIDSCCETLDCLSEKTAQIGEECANIDTGGIIDGGKGSYFSSSFSDLSSKLLDEKQAYQVIMDAIDKKIAKAHTDLINLPENCENCDECCPPTDCTTNNVDQSSSSEE